MKSNAHLVESIEVGVGGELGVKDQLLRKGSRACFPKVDEAEDLVMLIAFSNLGIGVAKDAGVGILSQKRQDALLPSAAF